MDVRRALGAVLVFVVGLTAGIPGCAHEGPAPTLDEDNVQLTLLHTADWHSRLIPYEFTVGQVDQNLGLVQDNGPFGGAARMTYLLQRERARAGRVLHLDSGDAFQGAPIFNFFLGEAEIRSLSASGCDVAVIGNHEFDAGAANFARQISRWATFPILAANYLFEPVDEASSEMPALASLAQPFTILNADGLKVGVIGIGNLSSLTSIFDTPNRLGIVPLETLQVAQFYIDLLRPLVDVVIMLTHSGVTADNRLVRNTSGIDIVLGGHLHVVLNPPQVVEDCSQIDEEGRHYIEIPGPTPSDPVVRRYCRPRNVIIAHSGAFMKYLGRIDLVLSRDPARVQPEVPANADRFPELIYRPDVDGYEILSHRYQVFPVDANVPDDPIVAEMLEPYEQEIANLLDLDLLVGYAPTIVRRFGIRQGDSPMGSLIATSMLLRLGIETDFALTNTTGIRADLPAGPVPVEQMFNVFPFENTVATMFLSGREVQEMFDFIARRSASRGCQSQAQIAGARVVLDCAGTGCGEGYAPGEACATSIAIGTSDRTCTRDSDCNEGELCDNNPAKPMSQWRCLLPITPDASYELATSNYLAGGGSGFRVLQRNTTTIDTQLPMRDVLVDYMRNGPPCGADESGHLPACSTDSDCREGFVCSCSGRLAFDEASRTCTDAGGCAAATGQCVLEACRADVSAFRINRSCEGAINELARDRCECEAVGDAGEECRFLACIDESLGAVTDGRVQMRAF